MVTVKLKNCNISPQKARLVADFVRGKTLEKAILELSCMNTKSSAIFKKVLDSGLANIENKGLDYDKAKLKTVRVDKARVLKRLMPRARGRADRIIKRYSHIFVEIGK